MIFVEIKGGKEVATYLGNRFIRMKSEIGTEMRRIAPDLQRHVKQDKLSGQVLRNRTGNLRRAINQLVTESDETISAIVGVAPNASKYGRAHEFGATIHIPAVGGKLMVFEAKDGSLVFTRKHRAYTVRLPERSFLRSALSERRASYISRISNAVKRGVLKK